MTDNQGREVERRGGAQGSQVPREDRETDSPTSNTGRGGPI